MSKEQSEGTPPLPGNSSSAPGMPPESDLDLGGISGAELELHQGGSGVNSLNNIVPSSTAISNNPNDFEGDDVNEEGVDLQEIETGYSQYSFATLLTANSNNELEGNDIREQRMPLQQNNNETEGNDPPSQDDESLLPDDDDYDNDNLGSLMLSAGNANSFELTDSLASVLPLPPLPPLPPLQSFPYEFNAPKGTATEATDYEIGQILEETKLETIDSTSQQFKLGGQNRVPSVGSTTSNQESCTNPPRYPKGRGSYRCNKCGRPRKGHYCQFNTLSALGPNECSNIRAQMMIAALCGRLPIQVDSQDENAQSNAALNDSNNSSSSQESRTISVRYKNIGRGAQNCTFCGQLRKEHSCLFDEKISRGAEEDHIDKMLSRAFHIGVRLREMFNDNDGQASSDGNEDNMNESEEHAHDEDSVVAKRQRKN